MGTDKKGLFSRRKKQAADAPRPETAVVTGPFVGEEAAAEAAVGTAVAPKPDGKRPKHTRRWALRRRQKTEPPPPAPPPVLQVRPFDKRDYRTLSLLLGGFKVAVGEPPLTQRQWAQLRLAIEEERITYYIAYFHGQPVGLCSLCLTYSDYLCAPSGVFEDFFVRPEARGQGIARALVQRACTEVRAHGGSSLSVACAPCDLEMYQALGFKEELGISLCRPL